MQNISVIVPVYKVEPYLHRCIDSILGQTYLDFKLILVDDGSPDNCGAICDEYAAKDSRVHVIHQENGGLSAARNAGIDWVFANSDSQWLAFIDSDDWVHRDYLKTLLENAENCQADMSACDFFQTDAFCQDGEIHQSVSCEPAEQAYCDHYGCLMSAWAKIFRKELFETLRFPVGKIHEDCYVTHIPLFAANKVVISTAPMYYYYSNPGSITRKKWSEKRLQEIEAHELRWKWLRENGYQQAARRELDAYCGIIFAQMQDLRILSKEEHGYRKYMGMLRPKMMELFRQARKMGLFAYSADTVWIYELAYPVKPFWYAYGICARIVAKGKTKNSREVRE